MEQEMKAALYWVFILAALLLLTACTTVKGSFCAISSPIRLSGETVDRLTDAEVKDILARNEKGRKLCGWVP